MTRLKTATVVALAAAVVATLHGATRGREERKAPAKAKAKEVTVVRALETMEWTLASANAGKRLIAVTDNQIVPKEGAEGAALRVRVIAAKDGTLVTGLYLSNLSVAADAKITLDGKAAKWGDLKAGQRVSLRLKKDRPVVTEVTAKTAKGPFKTVPPVWKLKSIAAKKKTVTLTNDRGLVVKDVAVADDARLSRMTVELGVRIEAIKLEDIKEGSVVSVELRAVKDRITASAIATAK